MKVYSPILNYFFYLLPFFLTVQQSACQTMVMQEDIFGTRNFIENKGQFSNPIGDTKVLFLYEHNGEKIWFTPRGLIFEQNEIVKKRGGRKNDEEENRTVTKARPIYIQMEWLNANPNSKIETKGQSHYFTYGIAQLQAHAFKEITYKDIYPGIDIQYTLPSDKSHGIKYNVKVHPGADISDFKMRYSGDIKSIALHQGQLQVRTRVDKITEYSPVAFYDNKTPLDCQFQLNGNILTFIFPKQYDTKNEITIDPWVTAVTTLTAGNCAYDVDYDNQGNTFIFGAAYSLSKIAKYSPAGTLLWTFVSSVPSQTWSTWGSHASNFVVNKTTGKCYTGQGLVWGGSRIIRIDSLGNYDNFITVADSSFTEMWEFSYSCIGDNIYFFGGSTMSSNTGNKLDEVTGILNPKNFQQGNVSCCQDVACATLDDQGKLFVIYASGSSTLTNMLCAVNSSLNGNVWTAPTSFTTLKEAENKELYFYPILSSNGYNCLAVNSSFLFYYDGYNLAAYSKLTGQMIGSTTISTHTLMQYGGIAVNECNQLFLGGSGSIKTYSFNGTGFSAVGQISLGITQTYPPDVYDLALDHSNGLLYVCGNGFVGTYTTTSPGVCGTGSLNLVASKSSICAGETVTLTVLGANSFTLAGSNITSGVVVVTPSTTTTYSVIASKTHACVSSTQTAVHTVTVSLCTDLVKESKQAQLVAVYPNPINDNLYINLVDCNIISAELTIYNSAGEIVFKTKLQFENGAERSVNLGHLPKGNYLATFVSKQHQQNIRFIRQ